MTRSAVHASVLLAFTSFVAGCDPDAACDDPGDICTYFGLVEKNDDGEKHGVAGLSDPGQCSDEAMTYGVVDSTLGPDGQLYVLDWNNHRIVTFDRDDEQDCDALRVVTGTTLLGDGPEGPADQASWNHPTNIAFKGDDASTMYVAAWHNSRIITVDMEAHECAFFAGTGGRAFNDDGKAPLETAFDLPSGVAFDAAGQLIIADQANQRVRRVTSAGVVETLVGTGVAGYSGDGGPGTAAQLFNELGQAANPTGRVAIDGTKMYIADTFNHRVRIYDLDTGIIETFAGTGEPGAGADQLNQPRDVAVGPDGEVYVADSGNHCVRRIVDGAMSTVAGVCGERGYDGDGGPASEALLADPFGIEVGPDGTLYVADTGNNLLRTVAPGE